jgi:hypothetical protein
MYYVLTFIVGVVVGGLCAALLVMDWYKKVKAREQASAKASEAAKARDEQLQTRRAELEAWRQQANATIEQQTQQLTTRETDLAARLAEFDRQVVSYRELKAENTLLKRDLQNVDVNLRKLEMDGELREERQLRIDERSTALAKRYLNETIKAVISSLGPSNFTACKQRLVDVISRVCEIGFAVSAEEEARLLSDLRKEFEKAVRAAFEREEQQRIKAQIREEERLKREIDRELKQLERERAAIQAALDQALAEAQGQHSAEVDRLKARLAEAEEKAKRTMSMAEQTKAGHVYVISNIGTFGPDVFKVGMTRRLEPQERVDELGCAAVPFPFDVHMMIHCDNAPSLENALHRALHRCRINRANPRKEFFRATLEDICKIVREHHGEVEFKADPEAAEYRQSLAMSEEDAAYIEHVYSTADEEESGAGAID